ncbi:MULTISPECIES: ABC transporter permease [Arthrobacter]|uniref:Transport permease protein n=2 Tax=Arthrobacter TaxID=1663 RepID=A0ABU9KPU4_9MICC|nr:ABC transporter permease [Arthrobacter sp. YJM1]MDP5228555.1 ABC transporter permease [Arthrobacter sp. YJM1]
MVDDAVEAPVQALSVDMRNLGRVGARPRFLEYLVQLWDFRGFIAYDARARVLSGTRRDRLGSAWLLLNPVFNGLTYYLIFGVLLHTSAGIDDFIGYLVVGLFIFQYCAGAISEGARSISSGRSVVQAFSFPRAALPIGANLREALRAVPLVIAMLLLVILLPPGEHIGLKWLLVIPALLLISPFNLGVSFILARIISAVGDVAHLLPFAIRAWMYGSAVFYSFDRFVTHPQLLQLLRMNPLFNVIDIVRSVLLYNRLPEWQSWAGLGMFAFGALVIGLVFFWQGEEGYVRG